MAKEQENGLSKVTAVSGNMAIAPGANFTLGDNVTINGADAIDASGAKIIPNTYGLINQGNIANSGATLTVMSSSSSSSSNSSPVALNSEGEENNIMIESISSIGNDGHLTVEANSTVSVTVQVPHITVKPGVTETFNHGIACPVTIDSGEGSPTVKLLENIMGPCSITGNETGEPAISFLSGENLPPELDHDA